MPLRFVHIDRDFYSVSKSRILSAAHQTTQRRPRWNMNFPSSSSSATNDELSKGLHTRNVLVDLSEGFSLLWPFVLAVCAERWKQYLHDISFHYLHLAELGRSNPKSCPLFACWGPRPWKLAAETPMVIVTWSFEHKYF